MYFSYQPFWDSLKKRGITQYMLIHEYHISRGTIHKLRHNAGMQLNTIANLCHLLDFRIDEFVQITKEKHPKDIELEENGG